ncbi:hypothetical protein NM432_14650 [Vibrio metschnikovii]
MRELSDRVSYLLKHDWERVKGEVNGGFNVYSMLLATVIAVLSVISFFFIVEFLSEKKELSFSTISVWFGGWLTSTVLIGAIIPCILKKVTIKKIMQDIMVLNRRLPYRKRSMRN